MSRKSPNVAAMKARATVAAAMAPSGTNEFVVDGSAGVTRSQRALADQETGFVSATRKVINHPCLNDNEKKKMEDYIHNYPFMDDLIQSLNRTKQLGVDRDPEVKKFIKEFHDGLHKRLTFRKIEGYPYEVEIVKETTDCPKLWRRLTNEFIKVKAIKDFKGINENLFEPLPERRVGLVRFFIDEPASEKRAVGEILEMIKGVFPASAKFVYKSGNEIICAFMDVAVIDDGKIGDYVTAKVYEQYYRHKKTLEAAERTAWERRDIANEKIKRLEAAGKNKKEHNGEFKPLMDVLREIDENHYKLRLVWHIEPLERGPTLARVLMPFSKDVTEILLGKEILANYNGFGSP